MVFTPDGDYPVVNFEKGRYAPCFGAEWESSPRGKRIIYITGGDTANIVPQKAQASVSGFELDEVSEYVQKYSKKCGLSITCAVSGDNIVINAVGKSAHASTPELGVNPQTALLEMLGDMPLDNSPCVNADRALSRLFPHGDVSGKAFKIDRNDADTGNLTLNFGVLKLDEKGFYANCDIRMPRGATRENTADTVNAALTACGFELKDTSDFTQYHYTPADGQFVKTLLDVYENYTGKKGECLAIGGGTYVHNIDGGVAFGCVMPGYDTRMHGDDERMPAWEICRVLANLLDNALDATCAAEHPEGV